MNHQNFAIGILSVTATILLVGLILLGSMSQQEASALHVDRGGDYVLLTSQWQSDREVLWVLDARSQVLGLYYMQGGALRLIEAIPLPR